MSYRSDLEAAHARADAAERRAAELQKQVDALERPAVDEPVVPIPERFVVDRSGGGLAVSWRWFKASQHLPLLFFSIAWDAFLVVWYFGAASHGAGAFHFIFPIAHVAVGVGITYSVLTGLLNRTTVRALGRSLEVQHAPLPWRGNRTLARGDIKQLYVASVEHRSKNRRWSTWDLRVVLADNRELKLVRGLDEASQAHYLERMFEAHLGIKDHPVPGSVAAR